MGCWFLGTLGFLSRAVLHVFTKLLYGRSSQADQYELIRLSRFCNAKGNKTITDDGIDLLEPFLENVFPQDSELSMLLSTANGSTPVKSVMGESLGRGPKTPRPVRYPASTSWTTGYDGSQSKDSLKCQTTPQSKSRMVLPMIIQGETLPARADSGSEENIIDLTLVQRLQISNMDWAIEHQRTFRVGNGKTIKALGRVKLGCAFGMDPQIQLLCSFYVVQSFVTPLVMGMSFLEDTETLSKYRHRLTPSSRIPNVQLCSINSPKRRLCCVTEGHSTLANADTGSDVNLISLNYAKANGYSMDSSDQCWINIQFADGEVSIPIGKVTLLIRLGRPGLPEYSEDFYVLADLQSCDVLLGGDFLYKTDAFKTYRDEFDETDLDDFTELNTIVWLGGIETWISSKVRRLARFGFLSDESVSDSVEVALSVGMLAIDSPLADDRS